MPRRNKAREAQRDGTITLYRVYIDYEAAGVNTQTATTRQKFYENKAGVNSKIRAALEMGVHPRFIFVQEVTGEWQPSPDYVDLCPSCKSMYRSPSPDCQQQERVQHLNEMRARANTRAASTTGRTQTYPLMELPHPSPYTIEEVTLP